MSILIVGKVLKNNKVCGYRLIDTSDYSHADIDINAIRQALAIGKVRIDNAILKDQELIGTNGSLERYGEVDGKQVLVVLDRVVDGSDTTIGFTLSDSNGRVKRLKVDDTVKIGEKCGIANGTIKSSQYGDGKFISSLNGTYDVKRINLNKNEESKADNKNTEIKNKENKYDGKNVIINIEKDDKKLTKSMIELFDRIENGKDRESENLRSRYHKRITEYIKNNEIPLTEEENIREVCARAYKDTDILANTRILDADTIKVRNFDEMSDCYEYIHMSNGELYIKGIKSEFYKHDIDTYVIPRTHNGENIKGIAVEAFSGNYYVKYVVIAENIVDIGQRAFLNCSKLELADLSRGKHHMIARETFKGCNWLRHVFIGEFVEKIHEFAFYKCSSLRFVTIPRYTGVIAGKAFADCFRLFAVKRSTELRSVNDSAFKDCTRLIMFSMKGLNTIGTRAFENTMLSKIEIDSTTNKIGRYAFYNAEYVKDPVIIKEGVREIGENAFSIELTGTKFEPLIHDIYLPNSLIVIGNNALKNCKNVHVNHGTASESYCIGLSINMIYEDEIDDKNSIIGRKRAEALGMSVLDILYDNLKDKNAKQLDVNIDSSKLINVELTSDIENTLGIQSSYEYKEPSNKFKGTVNLLTACTELYTVPLSRKVIRYFDCIKITGKTLYEKDGNCIRIISYITKDTLEEGRYVIVVINHKIVYMCENSYITNMTLDGNIDLNNKKNECKESDNQYVGVELLHIGDTLGNNASISGESCNYKTEDGYTIKIGKDYLDILCINSAIVQTSAHDYIVVIPGCGKALELHDGRTYDKEHKVKRGTPDCINVMGIITLEEAYDKIRHADKKVTQYNKYFNDIEKAKDAYIKYRKSDMNFIAEESISKLYFIAQEFGKRIAGKEKDEITPNDLTPEIFKAVANSYWMISKEMEWFKTTNKKAFNLIAKYNIGNYLVDEYVSNQVVKFYNPYMSGGVGSHIFILKSSDGKFVESVYASSLSLDVITKNLVSMITYNKNDVVPLMTSPRSFSEVDNSLFFHFYDVLYNKNSWNIGYSGCYANFYISMYKPTGVMYLTATRFYMSKDKSERGRVVVIPLFKIGDIDRALTIAGKTNTSNRDTKAIKEMQALVSFIVNGSCDAEDSRIVKRYIEARSKTLKGVREVSEYEGLINDRFIYMIGTKASGDIKVYESSYEQLEMLNNSDIEIEEEEPEEDDEYIDPEEYDIDEDEIYEEEEDGPDYEIEVEQDDEDYDEDDIYIDDVDNEYDEEDDSDGDYIISKEEAEKIAGKLTDEQYMALVSRLAKMKNL